MPRSRGGRLVGWVGRKLRPAFAVVCSIALLAPPGIALAQFEGGSPPPTDLIVYTRLSPPR